MYPGFVVFGKKVGNVAEYHKGLGWSFAGTSVITCLDFFCFRGVFLGFRIRNIGKHDGVLVEIG